MKVLKIKLAEVHKSVPVNVPMFGNYKCTYLETQECTPDCAVDGQANEQMIGHL